MMKKINRYLQALVDRQLAPSALKVALVVGSILFVINHGAAVVKGNMRSGRWLSGLWSIYQSLSQLAESGLGGDILLRFIAGFLHSRVGIRSPTPLI